MSPNTPSSITPTGTLVHRVGSTHTAPDPAPVGLDLPRIDEPVELSPKLYNHDLAPTQAAGRRWSSYSIFTLWANDVHSLGNYGFALGLFALGLGGWQILVALGVGAALLFLLLTFSGFMGQKTGVPFPVMSRISFGIRGAQIPALIRGGVAIVWFGIQTYLASLVLRVLLIALAPGLKDLDHNAESCEGNFESYLAAIAVMDKVLAYPDPFDAVIQAGYGEHGREGLQELLDVPVVDITEAAASTAMFLGYKYSVVTTLDRTVPLIEDRLKLAGLDARCASVRASGLAVLELEEDADRAVATIIEQAQQAVTVDKAELIVLGCGGMSGLDRAIRERAGVPVVDGIAAAVTIAESLVRLGLSTSKVRTYAAPRDKRVIGWPRNF